MGRKSVYKSKLTGSEKVKTVVYISKPLFEKVVSLAVQVYGVQRGALSLAVEEALELWVSLHTQQHTRTNPRMPLRDRYNAVMECIRAEVGTIPITIHQLFLEKCISNVLDIKDPRSIYSWLHRFYMAGLIRPLTIKVAKPSDWAKNKAVELVAKAV